MSASIHELTSPEVAERLRAAPAAVIPFGSIEQHGPHLPCGTDTMAAELVARELAARLGALYAPFCPYGVTPIHAGHPGTVSLSRNTFEALVSEVCRELVEMGARTLILVNWHELNGPSLDAVATDVQDELEVHVYVAQACYVAQRVYADDGGSLTHGGSIETMAVLAYDPRLAKLDPRGPRRPMPDGAPARYTDSSPTSPRSPPKAGTGIPHGRRPHGSRRSRRRWSTRSSLAWRRSAPLRT